MERNQRASRPRIVDTLRRRRRRVQHVPCETREPAHGPRIVEVHAYRHAAGRTHRIFRIGPAHDAEDPRAGRVRPHEPKPDVAAAEHEHPGPPEASRQ
jgi:hypothetical protein